MAQNGRCPVAVLAVALVVVAACQAETPAVVEPSIRLTLSPTRLNAFIRQVGEAAVVARGGQNPVVLVDTGGGSVVQVSVAEGTPFQAQAVLALENGRAAFRFRCQKAGEAQIYAALAENDRELAHDIKNVQCFSEDRSAFRLLLSANRTSVRPGRATTVTVTALDDRGNPRSGLAFALSIDRGRILASDESVQEEPGPGVDAGAPAPPDAGVVEPTACGPYRESDRPTQTGLTDQAGQAKVRVQCLDCPGVMTVRAWFVNSQGQVDRSTGPGIPSETRIVCTAGEAGAGIELTADKAEVLADDEDRTRVDLVVRGFSGAPVPSVEVVLTADRGRLRKARDFSCGQRGIELPPSRDRSRMSVTTDERGGACLYFVGGGEPGPVLVEARADVSEAENPLVLQGQLVLDVVGIGGLRFLDATPPRINVRGSCGRDNSLVRFALVSTRGTPLPAGFRVDFSLPSVGSGGGGTGPSLTRTRGRTDADGIVSTTLVAGTYATPVSVRATARLTVDREDEIHSDSPAIPVVGCMPASGGFVFACDKKNVGALLDNDGVSSLVDETIPCRVSLKDRFGNPMGFATYVSFMTEAGTITPHVLTKPYDPGGSLQEDQPDMGTAEVVLRTRGPLPRDVLPIPGEPTVQDGAITRNPRDGFVTLVAYTAGEEEFRDLNANGRYDEGEPFVDMPEPFVDANDNGIRDPGEEFKDVAGGVTGEWDGPNGRWDDSTIIWTEARVLFTSGPRLGAFVRGGSGFRPYGGRRRDGCQTFDPSCSPAAFILQKDSELQSTELAGEVWWRDINLNLLNPSTRYRLTVEGGAVFRELNDLAIPDTFGFEFGFRRVASRGGGGLSECTWLRGEVCRIEPHFGRFGTFCPGCADVGGTPHSGYSHRFVLGAAAAAGAPCCAIPPPDFDPHDTLSLDPADEALPQCQVRLPPPPPPAGGGGADGGTVDAGEGPLAAAFYARTWLTAHAEWKVSPDNDSVFGSHDIRIGGWACGTGSAHQPEPRTTGCVRGRVVFAARPQVGMGNVVVRLEDPEGHRLETRSRAGPQDDPSTGTYCIEGVPVEVEHTMSVNCGNPANVPNRVAADGEGTCAGPETCPDLGAIRCALQPPP